MEIPVVVGISPTLHIRGLLAARDIAEGEVIESCPVVLIPVAQEDALERTTLNVYYFLWTKDYYCFVLGYGNLFNHSYHANVLFTRDYERKLIVFRAARNIHRGEELTTNYNGELDDETPIHPDFLR